MKLPSPGLSLIASFVWWGAVLSLTGWVLSFFRILTPISYGLVLAILTGTSFLFLKDHPWSIFFRRTLKRLRRPLPAIFAGSGCLVLVGALLYSPSNYDALSYRIPRIMHWLHEEGWSWISTASQRQNYSGTGQEWLLAPLIALTRTDLLLFMPNWLAYCLLPSVFFRLLRGSGISGRSAFFWMWLLPLAPVFLLQAGGISNDLLGAFWFLASLALIPGSGVLSPSPSTSLIALALATGVKASNLILIFPWLVNFALAFVRNRGLLRPALLALPLAVTLSFAPMALLNWLHTDDWTGDPANEGKMKAESFWPTWAGNGISVSVATLQQPINFLPGDSGRRIMAWLPGGLGDTIRRAYPRWEIPKDEFSIEENAGWAWPLLALGLVGWFGSFRGARNKFLNLLCLAGWVAGFVMMGKLASEAMPRLLAPLYPVLFLPLWVQPKFRHKFFSLGGIGVGLFLLIPLLLAPGRPLVPWLTIGSFLDKWNGSRNHTERVQRVQQAYQERSLGLAPLIPPNLSEKFLSILVVSSGNDTEGPLWWPLGERYVRTIRVDDPWTGPLPDLILIRERDWPAWNDRVGVSAKLQMRKTISLLARTGPEPWLSLTVVPGPK